MLYADLGHDCARHARSVSYTQAGSSPESILAFRGHILEAAWTSCCFAASLTTKQVAALLLQDFQGLIPGEQTYSCLHVSVALALH